MKLKEYLDLVTDNWELTCWDNVIDSEFYMYKKDTDDEPDLDFPNVEKLMDYLKENLEIKEIHTDGVTVGLYELLDHPDIITFAKQNLYEPYQYSSNDDVVELLFNDMLVNISDGYENLSGKMLEAFDLAYPMETVINQVKVADIDAILVQRDYKGEYERFALTPDEFKEEFPEVSKLIWPIEEANTHTLRPLVHIWYSPVKVGDEQWNAFFTDMEDGLPYGDISNGNLAYIRDDFMGELKQYLPKVHPQEPERKDCFGGLTREELEEKIMEGIVNGALGIEYGQIAPYSYGYEVTFGIDTPSGSTHGFSNRWECYVDLFDVPKKIVDKINEGSQDNVVFGAKCQPLDIELMLQKIEEAENHKLTKFTPFKDTDFQIATSPNHYPYRNSVASVMDVHNGKGLDGIVQHKFHGTYSTMTPAKQNSLVETLVCMKGFCLDGIHNLDVGRGEQDKIIQYLKQHGTDISTPGKLDEWIKNNPDKCAYEQNRMKTIIQNKSVEEMMKSAANRTASSHPTTSDSKSTDNLSL